MITIALAAYNVEEYLEDCLKSVLVQNYTDFELICIDDGSKDKTLQILQHYEKLDGRIRIIINPVNEGLAVARNLSIKEAKGEYIWMIDGDDIYAPDLLEKAVAIAEKDRSDIVIWDYVVFTEVHEIISEKKSLSRLQDKNSDDRLALLKTPAFTWVKLIKVEMVRELKINFPKGYTRQDIPVHWHLMTMAKKISILPEKLSYYRQQPNATTAQKNDKLLHLAFVLDDAKKNLVNNGNWELYSSEFYRQQLNLLFGMYDNIRQEFKDKALFLIKERLTQDHYNYIDNNEGVRKQAKWFYQSLKNNKIAKLKFYFWKKARSLYRTIKR